MTTDQPPTIGGIWNDDFLGAPGHKHREIKGVGSRVRVDEDAGVVSKLYRPKKWLQAFYWICFQAPFPYRGNVDALRAAELRRDIADAILEYEIAPGLVARPHDQDGDPRTFDTDFVEGSAAVDRQEARAFLGRVTRVFLKAGLPTWQVAPWQPRAIGNVVARSGGGYQLIDLESNLVSPFVPLSQLGDYLDQGIWPTFDDINLKRLQRYVVEHERGLKDALGDEGYADLRAAILAYEESADRWHDSEPRLPSRALRAIWRTLTLSCLRKRSSPRLVTSPPYS